MNTCTFLIHCKLIKMYFVCRLMLEQEEQSIDQLEQKLEKILKICTSMIETGKTYVGQQRFEKPLYEKLVCL